MKTIILQRETLSEEVSPRPWYGEGDYDIRDRQGDVVCSCYGYPKEINRQLLLLTPELAQFALDMYWLLARMQIETARHYTQEEIGEAFEQCGKLAVALAPLAVPVVSELQDDDADAEEPVRRCRVCGCTNADCRQCIVKTGKPCTWVGKEDLCSACTEDWML